MAPPKAHRRHQVRSVLRPGNGLQANMRSGNPPGPFQPRNDTAQKVYSQLHHVPIHQIRQSMTTKRLAARDGKSFSYRETVDSDASKSNRLKRARFRCGILVGAASPLFWRFQQLSDEGVV